MKWSDSRTHHLNRYVDFEVGDSKITSVELLKNQTEEQNCFDVFVLSEKSTFF